MAGPSSAMASSPSASPSAPMHLGLVVPRYGEMVVGGTEHWLRMLCEHLVAMKQWRVEVFTTCATSAATWRDELAPGDSVLGGVTVHRHRSRSGRDPRYLELNAVIGDDPAGVPDDVARLFVELVGPVCPDVLDDAAASACDLVAVTPYLFWPAVHGVPRLGRRVIFHGAAHDEPELHLGIMRDVFLSVGGFAFNSYAERALVERTFPIAHLPARVIGNSVAEEPGDPAAARAALGLSPDEPFVLCVGRVERSKGTHALAELWRRYRRRRGRDAPRLVLLGPVHEELVSDGDVLVAGQVPEQVKWGALRGCCFLVAPSPWESFSLVVLEAWLAGRPVLVNGRCEATVEHSRRGGGGLWFGDEVEFEVMADRLLSDGSLRDHLASMGEAYARRQFSWPAVVDRYATLADHIRARLHGSEPEEARHPPL
jgi:glycosyltransferase involved in cell wall biosynthesis